MVSVLGFGGPATKVSDAVMKTRTQGAGPGSCKVPRDFRLPAWPLGTIWRASVYNYWRSFMAQRLITRTLVTAIAFGVLGFSLAGGLSAQSGSDRSGPCDRACLEGFVDRYLDAVTAHDPALVPLAKNVKLTENGQKLTLPDGLWNSMVGKGKYRFVRGRSAGGRGGIHRDEIQEGGTNACRARGGSAGVAAETGARRNL